MRIIREVYNVSRIVSECLCEGRVQLPDCKGRYALELVTALVGPDGLETLVLTTAATVTIAEVDVGLDDDIV